MELLWYQYEAEFAMEELFVCTSVGDWSCFGAHRLPVDRESPVVGVRSQEVTFRGAF